MSVPLNSHPQLPSKHPLREIPGVGKSVAGDLIGLGYNQVCDLAGEDPEEMYERLCNQCGVKVDRCMLYVFRCAVYYASEESRDSEKLKWWYWKDHSYP